MTQLIKPWIFVWMGALIGSIVGFETWRTAIPAEAVEILNIASEMTGAHTLAADENDLLAVLRNHLIEIPIAGSGLLRIDVGAPGSTEYVYWESSEWSRQRSGRSWLGLHRDLEVRLGSTVRSVSLDWRFTPRAALGISAFAVLGALLGLGIAEGARRIRERLGLIRRNRSLENTVVGTAHDLAPVAAGLRVLQSAMGDQAELSALVAMSERRLSSIVASLRSEQSDEAKTNLSTLDRYLRSAIVGLPNEQQSKIHYQVDVTNPTQWELSQLGWITRVLDNFLRNACDEVMQGRATSIEIRISPIAHGAPSQLSVRFLTRGASFSASVLASFRTGTVKSTKPGGEGIGLHSSYVLMKKIGGDLVLRNSEVGSVAEAIFPVREIIVAESVSGVS